MNKQRRQHYEDDNEDSYPHFFNKKSMTFFRFQAFLSVNYVTPIALVYIVIILYKKGRSMRFLTQVSKQIIISELWPVQVPTTVGWTRWG